MAIKKKQSYPQYTQEDYNNMADAIFDEQQGFHSLADINRRSTQQLGLDSGIPSPYQTGANAFRQSQEQYPEEEPEGVLGAVGSFFNPNSQYFALNYPKEMAKGIAEQFVGIPTSLLNIANLADPTNTLGEAADTLEGWNQEYFSGQKEYGNLSDRVPFNSDYWANPSGAMHEIPGLIGSMLALKGASQALGALGKVSKATRLANAARTAVLGKKGLTGAEAIAEASTLEEALSLPAAFYSKLSGKGAVKVAEELGKQPQWVRVLVNGSKGFTAEELASMPFAKRAAIEGLTNMSGAEALSEAGEAAGDTRKEGGSKSEQLAAALRTGALEWGTLSALNRVQAVTALKMLGADNVATAIMAGGLEMGQNYFEEGFQNMAQKWGKGETSLGNVYNPANWDEDAHIEGFAGAMGSALVGGLGRAFGKSKNDEKIEAAQEQAAQNKAQTNEAVARNAKNEIRKANFTPAEARSSLEQYLADESSADSIRADVEATLLSGDENAIVAKAQEIELMQREVDETIATPTAQTTQPNEAVAEAPVEAVADTRVKVQDDDIEGVPFAADEEVQAAMQEQQMAEQAQPLKQEAVTVQQQQPMEAAFNKHHWLNENPALGKNMSGADKSAVNKANAAINNAISDNVKNGVYDADTANALSGDISRRVNVLLGNVAENITMTGREANDALNEINELEGEFGVKGVIPSSVRAYYKNQIRSENANNALIEAADVIDRFKRGEIDYQTAQAAFPQRLKSMVAAGDIRQEDAKGISKAFIADLKKANTKVKAEKKEAAAKAREEARIAQAIAVQQAEEEAERLRRSAEAKNADIQKKSNDAYKQEEQNNENDTQATSEIPASTGNQVQDQQPEKGNISETDNQGAGKNRKVEEVRGWINIPEFAATNEFSLRKLVNGDYNVIIYTSEGAEPSKLKATYVAQFGGDPFKALEDAYTFDESEPAKVVENPNNRKTEEENAEPSQKQEAVTEQSEQDKQDEDAQSEEPFDIADLGFGQVFHFDIPVAESASEADVKEDVAIEQAETEEKVEKIVGQRKESEDVVEAAFNNATTTLKKALNGIKKYDWRQIVRDAMGKKPVVIVKTHDKAKDSYALTYDGHVGLIDIGKAVAEMMSRVDKDTHKVGIRKWLGEGDNVSQALSAIDNNKEMYAMYDFFNENEEERATVNDIIDLYTDGKADISIVNDGKGLYIVTLTPTEGGANDARIVGKESATLISRECGVEVEKAITDEIPKSVFSDYLSYMGDKLSEDDRYFFSDTVEVEGKEMTVEEACRKITFWYLKDGTTDIEKGNTYVDVVDDAFAENYNEDDAERASGITDVYREWLEKRYENTITKRAEEKAKAYSPRDRVEQLVCEKVNPNTGEKYKNGDDAVLNARVNEILAWVDKEDKLGEYKTSLARLNDLLDLYNKSHQKSGKGYTQNEKAAAGVLKEAVGIYNNNNGNPSAVKPVQYSMVMGKHFTEWCKTNKATPSTKAAKEYISTVLVQQELGCSFSEAGQIISDYMATASEQADAKNIANTVKDVVEYYQELQKSNDNSEVEATPLATFEDANKDMSNDDLFAYLLGGDVQAQIAGQKQATGNKQQQEPLVVRLFAGMIQTGARFAKDIETLKLAANDFAREWHRRLRETTIAALLKYEKIGKEKAVAIVDRLVRPTWEILNALPKTVTMEVNKIKHAVALAVQAKAAGANLKQAKAAASQIVNPETNSPYKDGETFVEAAFKAYDYLSYKGGMSDVYDDTTAEVSGRTEGNRDENQLGADTPTTDIGTQGGDVEPTGGATKREVQTGTKNGEHSTNDLSSIGGERGNNGAVQETSTAKNGTSGGQHKGGSSSSSRTRVQAKWKGTDGLKDGSSQSSDARSHKRADTREAKAQQEIIASIGTERQPKVIRNDANNIKETLPVLLKDQAGDILKMEERFFGNGKQAFLVGNGTGTGKTFVGLGAIVRHMLSSKTPVLVVVPSTAIKNEWMKDAYEQFGITNFHEVAERNGVDPTKINITTYGSLVKNPNLIKNNWGMVAFDEAHHLASGQSTWENYSTTASVQVMRGLTGHESEHGYTGWRRLKRSDIFNTIAEARKELEAANKKAAMLRRTGGEESAKAESTKAAALVKRIDAELTKLKATDKADREEYARYKAEAKKGKVLFLSATPFEYSTDIYWGEGYLFNYSDFGGYDKLMSSLGLQPKQKNPEKEDLLKGITRQTGKVTIYEKPKIEDRMTGTKTEADLGAYERRFHYKLKDTGAFITRRLNTPMDYSRKFVIVSSDETKSVIDGIREIVGSEEYSSLGKAFGERLQGAKMRRFFEIIKTRALLDEVEKSLANGDHILFVHKFKKSDRGEDSGIVHPFKLSVAELRQMSKQAQRNYEDFCASPLGKKLQSLPLDTSLSVPEILKERFGDKALVVNGDIAAGVRAEAVDEFNKPGAHLLVATADAIGEGVSVHDKVGGQRRKLINVAIPEKPSDVAQIEARIFRWGQQSNAQMYYVTSDTPQEQLAYIYRASAKAQSQENLSVGNEARSFVNSFNLNYLRALTGSINGNNVKISEDNIDTGSKAEDAGVDAEGNDINFDALIQEQREILAGVAKEISENEEKTGRIDQTMSDAVSRAQAQLDAMEKSKDNAKAENRKEAAVRSPEKEARIVNSLKKLCFAESVDNPSDGAYIFNLRNGVSFKVNFNYSSLQILGYMTPEQRAKLKNEANYIDDVSGIRGLTAGNTIFLTELADGTTAPHELMHFIFNVVLKPSQRKILLGWAKYNMEHGIVNPFTGTKGEKVSFEGKSQAEIDARCMEYIADGLPKLLQHEDALRNAKGLTGALRRIFYDIKKWFANLKAAIGKETPLGIYLDVMNGNTYNNEQQNAVDNSEAQAQLAGENSRTADKDALKRAKKMQANGDDRREIFMATGWYQGKDGGWRYWLKDDINAINFERLANMKTDERVNLSEVYKNDDLYSAYPELAEIEIGRMDERDGGTLKRQINKWERVNKWFADLERDESTSILLGGIDNAYNQKLDAEMNIAESKIIEKELSNQEKYDKGVSIGRIEEEQKRKDNTKAMGDAKKHFEAVLKRVEEAHVNDKHSVWKAFKHAVLNLFKSTDIKAAEHAGVNLDEQSDKTKLELSSVLNGIKFLISPSWVAEGSTQIAAFVKMGVKASRVQEELRSKWLAVYQQALAGLKSDKEILTLNKLLYNGDAEGKEYTDAELKKQGVSENVIKAYKTVRKLLDEIYDEIDKAHRHVNPKIVKMVKGKALMKKIAEINGDKFNFDIAVKRNSDDQYILLNKFDINKIDENEDYDITYMRPNIIKEHRVVLRSELEHLRADPNTQVVSVTVKKSEGSKEDYVEVELNRTIPSITKTKGYMPHIFEEWIIVAETKDKNGRPVKTTLGSAKTKSAAAKKSEEIKRAILNDPKLKDAEVKVRPKIYDPNVAFGGTGADEFMGYFGTIISTPEQAKKFKQDLIKKGLSAEEAEAIMKEHLKMSQAHRFLGSLIERTGALGYNADMLESLERYIRMTSRYVALEDFKSTAIPLYERTFGTSFDLEAPTKKYESAGYIKRYILNINGTPNAAEKWLNNVLKNIPWYQEHITANYGDRAALGLGSRINQFWATVKLSGISSGLVNMLQLANSYAFCGMNAMSKGIKGAYMIAQKPPEKGSADYDKYMLYKQIIKDSGVEVMMNMSDVTGYTKNRPTIEATKNGKLEKALQFWRYLSDKGLYLFRASDHISRIITAIAAYEKYMEDEEKRLGSMTDKDRKQKYGKAIEKSEEVLRKAMFDYGVADTSLAMQNLTGTGFGELILLFKKYPMKEMELMLNMAGMLGNETSRRERLRFWLTYALMCGISGIPLGDIIDDILETLFGYRLTTLLKAKIIAGLGNNPFSRAICYGLPGISGVDISRRAGMADLVPTSGLLETMGGVTFSSFKQLADGYRQDDYIKMMKAISPAIGNAAEASRGIRYDSKGRIAYKYDAVERLPKAMGFRLANESVISDLQSHEWQTKNATDEKRKLTMYRYAKKVADGEKLTADEKAELKKNRVSHAAFMRAVKDMKKTTAERVLSYMPKEKKKEYKPLLE